MRKLRMLKQDTIYVTTDVFIKTYNKSMPFADNYYHASNVKRLYTTKRGFLVGIEGAVK